MNNVSQIKNAAAFILRVSYSWTAQFNTVSLTQFLGNGHVEQDGSLSTCASVVSRLAVGDAHIHRDAFGCETTYTRIA